MDIKTQGLAFANSIIYVYEVSFMIINVHIIDTVETIKQSG